MASLVMEQYASIKREHPDRILLYRIGDFYEMFYGDAELVSDPIGITLTRRKSGGKLIPMCGIPRGSLDQYVIKLIAQGFSVAVCDQVEDSSSSSSTTNPSKSIMKRKVVRIITKGTVVDSELLEGSRSNYIACINNELNSLAWADISTGQFRIMEGDKALAQLHSVDPSEVVVARPLAKKLSLGAVQVVDPDLFVNPVPTVKSRFADANFDGVSDNLLLVCGALISYLNQVGKGYNAMLTPPVLIRQDKKVFIDSSTWRSLELVESVSDKKGATLFGVLNRTLTHGGARLLRSVIREPLLEKEKIGERLSCVEFFLNNYELTARVRKIVKSLPDIERILGRVHFNRTSPRELGKLRDGLKSISRLSLICRGRKAIDTIFPTTANLHGDIIDLLVRSFKQDDLPHSQKDGGFIAEGYDKRVDKLRAMVAKQRKNMSSLGDRYAAKFGRLQLCYSPLTGFYFEVPSKVVPCLTKEFLHKQSLKDKSRYVTEELMEMESSLGQVERQLMGLESLLFEQILVRIKRESLNILATVEAASHIDLFSSWAILAKERNYTRPKILLNGKGLKLMNSLHPILQEFGNPRPNHCDLSKDRIILLTGANMGGKSTFSRQVALIAIMSQMGCFVPADSAEVSLADKVFCRSGCRDNIVDGQSSFMVEMSDLSHILNNITDRSLVILDEVGSGTSPKEGAAMLQAVLEYISNVGCRCICTTHYFELVGLREKLGTLKNCTVEKGYKVVEGIGSFSHALDVAKAAGVPDSVIKRARTLLKL